MFSNLIDSGAALNSYHFTCSLVLFYISGKNISATYRVFQNHTHFMTNAKQYLYAAFMLICLIV